VARKIHYWITNHADNVVTDEEWEQVIKLQHWYNSEFIWTAGSLTLKMYLTFPNWDNSNFSAEQLLEEIKNRKSFLRSQNIKNNQIIRMLESEGLLIVKYGGIKDSCLASGCTRTASNEYNSYLVCEFLLKASRILKCATTNIYDEGKFIKTSEVSFRDGDVIIQQQKNSNEKIVELVKKRKLFSIVNPIKYDDVPIYGTVIDNYADLTPSEKLKVLHDWNWLGFENSFDIDGDDYTGLNLNLKVKEFIMM
jgi:hypothetical protein